MVCLHFYAESPLNRYKKNYGTTEAWNAGLSVVMNKFLILLKLKYLFSNKPLVFIIFFNQSFYDELKMQAFNFIFGSHLFFPNRKR